MFDEGFRVAPGSPRALLRIASDTHDEWKAAGCGKLVIAAAWADAHSEVDEPERLVEMGPRGCPLVAETCPAELALAFQTSVTGARGMIGDALNLRHRLPVLWRRVVAGDVHAWKARRVAQATAQLNPAQSAEVDVLLAGELETLAWRRLELLLDATLLHVDELGYRERAARAAAERDVYATQSSDGLRTLIARANAGDVTVVLAMLNRLADALAHDGDEDPVGARRAKALGVIAYPERVLDLLGRHRCDPSPHLEPDEQAAQHAQADPTDPWAPSAPPAGWQTDRHANYHAPQPGDNPPTGEPPPEEEPPEEAPPQEEPVREASPRDAAAGGRSTEADAPPAPPDTAGGRRWANRGGLDLDAVPSGDLSAARPTVLIHLHLSDEAVRTGRGVVRTEHGPITVDQLRQFLGDTCPNVKVYPEIDSATIAAVDSYEIPGAVRRGVAIRHPGSVFPFSPCLTGAKDLDHTIRHRRDGPPGQTGVDTLGPLARREHQPKTLGRWQARQPDPGIFVWRTPHGWISLTTNQGTLVLGDGPFATTIWRAALTANGTGNGQAA